MGVDLGSLDENYDCKGYQSMVVNSNRSSDMKGLEDIHVNGFDSALPGFGMPNRNHPNFPVVLAGNFHRNWHLNLVGFLLLPFQGLSFLLIFLCQKCFSFFAFFD